MRRLIFSFISIASLFAVQARATSVDLLCELGQSMTVIGDHSRDNRIELQWKGRSYYLQRVSTSTGAHRFEDIQSGLIWIGIPAKAMLLDSRLGMPVANECKAATQHRAAR